MAPDALAWNRYGKSRLRLVKVSRAREPHDVLDYTIDVQLEGAFEPVYVDGDNSSCLATDTMKNTVYALARTHEISSPESFASILAAHFIAKPAVERVRITIVEQAWRRLAAGGAPHPHAFVQPGGEQWTTVVTRDRVAATVVSGVSNVVVLKTTDSSFSGFPRDAYTTLPETDDRILATAITATWTYRGHADYGQRARIRAALVDTFAVHASRSVQHTLYAMAQAALAASADLVEITLSLPNRHHLLVDLTAFGLDNPNEIFVATDQPYGLIEATVRRTRE